MGEGLCPIQFDQLGALSAAGVRQQIELEPGDLLVGYTDGVTEARSPEDEFYTRDRLQSMLSQPFNSAAETLERIKTNLFSFIDIAPRGDDVTMLAVQRASG